MELSLHGSQINLATRSKPTQAAVQYPPPISSLLPTSSTIQQHFRLRPSSANRNINRCSSASPLRKSEFRQLQQHHQRRRPLSADSKVVDNNLNYVGGMGGKLKRKARLNSSSNILNLLLAEPIKRSWESPDCIKRSQKVHQKRLSKPKIYVESECSSNDSSIEEQIDFLSNDEDNWSQRTRTLSSPKILPKNGNILKNSIPKGSLSSKLTKDSVKKYVTFSNNTEIVTRSQSSSEFSGEKPDLPGRVSFSKNEVYEIDYSDYEIDSNSETNSMNLDKPPEKIETKSLSGEDSSKKMEPPNNKEKYCCSKKCNSMFCSSLEDDFYETPYEPNSSHQTFIKDEDETDRVITNYKKTVEDLNFAGEIEFDSKMINEKNVITTDSEISPNKLENNITDTKMYTKSNEEIADYSVFAVNDPKQTVEKSVKMSIENEQEINELWKTASNGNAKNKNNLHNELATGDAKDSSTDIIRNYLKETNLRIHPKSAPPKQCNLAPKSQKQTKKRPPKKPTTKSAPPGLTGIYCREESNLGEFQLDKVESWMTMHEKSFQEPNGNKRKSKKIDGINRTEDENEMIKTEWRDTPESKTDDEGNFSFEDAVDDISNEETTYNEIVSVIKEIEEQKRQDQGFDIKNENTSNHLTISLESNRKSSATNTDPTTDRMKDILSYLDEVDSSCEKTISESYSIRIPDSFRSEIEFAVEPDVVGDLPNISDLLMLPNQQLARRVVALSLRANELSNAVQLAKEHMAKVRGDKIKAVRIEKQNGQARLAEQKKNAEIISGRHQAFIEQLLKDKAILCEKTAALTRRIESQSQAWEHKLQTEIVRVKETTMAGEKIRRERWVKENTKKIKELTVKGLEQEINRMTHDHQKEITELKRQHQEAVLKAIDEERQKHETIEMGIRESYAQDREMAIEKERNAIRERFDRQMEEEQKSFEEQKSRIIQDYANEKERLYIEIKEKEAEFERRREDIITDKNETIEALKNGFQERIKNVERKNDMELASIREQFESDFAIWKREHESTYKLREVEMENSIRQQCRIERDKQIDNIIEKVDAETFKSQQEFDLKLSRLKEKHEQELRESEINEKRNRDLYTEVRTKLAESDANKQNLQSTLKQMEIELNHSQKMCNDLLKEKENLKDAARNEIQAEIDNIRRERDQEIEKIYSRVQQAIEKKDATVEFLQKENGSLKERCIKLEAIIRQQRKDYCTK